MKIHQSHVLFWLDSVIYIYIYTSYEDWKLKMKCKLLPSESMINGKCPNCGGDHPNRRPDKSSNALAFDSTQNLWNFRFMITTPMTRWYVGEPPDFRITGSPSFCIWFAFIIPTNHIVEDFATTTQLKSEAIFVVFSQSFLSEWPHFFLFIYFCKCTT